jgi:hypothetical protein
MDDHFGGMKEKVSGISPSNMDEKMKGRSQEAHLFKGLFISAPLVGTNLSLLMG